MAKPELGSKQKCQNCGTKFFDLLKDPVVCPKCGTVQSGGAPMAARGAAAARQAPAADDEEPDTEAPEVVSLDDADQIDDGKVAAVSPEDDIDVDSDDSAADDDTFLEEEEDDGGDVSDLIDGDIEDDEER